MAGVVSSASKSGRQRDKAGGSWCVGAIWMIVRVIADQTGDASERRYRDVDR